MIGVVTTVLKVFVFLAVPFFLCDDPWYSQMRDYAQSQRCGGARLDMSERRDVRHEPGVRP
jgi:hypothetical protein